ncbi:MAG: hypothetical protein IJZ45_00050 [Bacteroidaceae bacterium]|nr:hypothetical protein [Bacteroidaceae bacterium]
MGISVMLSKARYLGMKAVEADQRVCPPMEDSRKHERTHRLASTVDDNRFFDLSPLE